MKKTIVLGASTNPTRYSYLAMHRLKQAGYEAFPIGIKKGIVAEELIRNDLPMIDDIDTITLYLNPKRQEEYYDYILSLHPKRIIFNPGTENIVLANLAKEKNIEVLVACTLVLLSTGQY